MTLARRRAAQRASAPLHVRTRTPSAQAEREPSRRGPSGRSQRSFPGSIDERRAVGICSRIKRQLQKREIEPLAELRANFRQTPRLFEAGLFAQTDRTRVPRSDAGHHDVFADRARSRSGRSSALRRRPRRAGPRGHRRNARRCGDSPRKAENRRASQSTSSCRPPSSASIARPSRTISPLESAICRRTKGASGRPRCSTKSGCPITARSGPRPTKSRRGVPLRQCDHPAGCVYFPVGRPALRRGGQWRIGRPDRFRVVLSFRSHGAERKTI